ncbi:MAG: acyclic terpene utilization AtuA family protein, partial [Parvularcula sp.]|nr:acyclic terpene utilization AtuA family protein [Parvularcula sp.]
MIRIGGASGYWGESQMATPQLLAAHVDVLVYDYLAEITMSLLARARMKDPALGYATDFVTGAMAPNLAEIARQGTKVVSNGGGMNPLACAAALRGLAAEQKLDLRIGVVTGDDLREKAAEYAKRGLREMFSKAPFPHPATVVSMNAYLGAFAVAEALREGADIVITGRSVDSAATLGALIAHYGWTAEDLDHLAAGSLVGHLLECGPQLTGGNFTDWRQVPRREAIGYPIAEVEADGSAVITKPEGTGGLVTEATVGEQLLYEIGDPSAYVLPDVTCDFTEVVLKNDGQDRVRISGARGRPAPEDLKVCATHLAGWRGGLTPTFYGYEAAEKAKEFARAVMARSEAALRQRNLAPYSEISSEIIGAGSHFGAEGQADEVTLKLAVRHPDEAGV